MQRACPGRAGSWSSTSSCLSLWGEDRSEICAVAWSERHPPANGWTCCVCFSSVLCSCWWLPRPTWRLRAYGSLSRDVCQWNPTPVWRLGDRLISGKLCKFTVIQSKFNAGAAEWMDDISCSGWSSKNCCLNHMTFIVLIICLVYKISEHGKKKKMWISDSVVCFVHNPETLSLLS